MASSPICPIVKGVLKLRPVMASSSILTELGAINQSCKTWTVRVRLKEIVCRISTDNGTEFVNQTLREYYEKVDISYETSVARSP
ncbi:integrase, catalytic region, zinc finger, CCHC-type containing protein [Tanacetum coccineum]